MNIISIKRSILFSILFLFLLSISADSAAGDSDENPGIISLNNGGPALYLPAEFEYHRIPRQLWETQLRRLAVLGFNSVRTPVPYAYHMPDGHSFNSEGLESYLELCRSLGLPVIVHPGRLPGMLQPPGNSYSPRSGYDDPLYWQQAKAWYNNLIPVLMPHLKSRGGIIQAIALQSMNDEWPGCESRDLLSHSREYLSAAGIDVPILIEESPEWNSRIFFECGIYGDGNLMQSGPAPFRRNSESSRTQASPPEMEDMCHYPLLRDGEFPEGTFSVRLWNSFLSIFGEQLARAGMPVHDLFIVNRYPPDVNIDINTWHASLLSGIAWDEPWFKSPSPPADWSDLRESPRITGLRPERHGIYAAFHTVAEIPDGVMTSPLYVNIQGLSGNIFLFINGDLAGKAYNIDYNCSIPCPGAFRKGKNIVVLVNEILPGRGTDVQIPDEIDLRILITSEIAYRQPVRILGESHDREISILLENTATTPQLFKFNYYDREQREERIVPSGNYLRLQPHEKRVFPMNFSIQGVGFNYTTSHIAGVAGSTESPLIILCDREGTPGEISIFSNILPKIGGTESYFWNKKRGELLINYGHKRESTILHIDRLAIHIVTWERASSTWLLETPLGKVPVFWDSAIPEKLTVGPDAWSLDFLLTPGDRRAEIMPVPRPRRIFIDGSEAPFSYNPERNEISFLHRVPQYETRNVEFMTVPSSAEHAIPTADILNELTANDFSGMKDNDHGALRFWHVPLPVNRTEKISPQVLLMFDQPVRGALLVNNSFAGIFPETLSKRGIHIPGGMLSEKKENSITVICREMDVREITLTGKFRTDAAGQRSRHRLEIFW